MTRFHSWFFLTIFFFPSQALAVGSQIELADSLIKATDYEELKAVDRFSPPFAPIEPTKVEARLRCDLRYVPDGALLEVEPVKVQPVSFFESFKKLWNDPSQSEPNDSEAAKAGSVQFSDPALAYLAQQKAAQAKDLERRLDNCEILRDNIIWQTPTGEKIPYPQWSAEQKQRLNELFRALVRGETDLGLQCPDPLVAISDQKGTYWSTEEAFDVFAAHVAHALYLEAEDKVPWRLSDHPPLEIQEILSSDRYYGIILAAPYNYYPDHIQPGRDYQGQAGAKDFAILRCDPRVGYHFMRGLGPDFPNVKPLLDFPYQSEDLVGNTPEATLTNLTFWVSRWVIHGSSVGSFSVNELANHSFLKDRLRVREIEGLKGVHALSGCHQSANLVRDLARSVNIPLLLTKTLNQPPKPGGGHYLNLVHGGVCWQWQQENPRCLWHMDELYAQSTEPSFPVDDQGNAVSEAERRRLLFLTHWRPPEELQAWGLNVNIHEVIPGQGLGINTRGASEDLASFDWTIGNWEMSDRQAAEDQTIDDFIAANPNKVPPARQFAEDLSKNLQLDTGYKLGNWTLMGRRCRGRPESLDQYMANRIHAQKTGWPWPFPYNSQNTWDRSWEILNAYGGDCNSLIAEWESYHDFRLHKNP